MTLCVIFSACGVRVSSSDKEEGGLASDTGSQTCATATVGRVIYENPRQEAGGADNLAFNANLSGFGYNVIISGLDGSCRLRNQFVSVTHDEFSNSIANVSDGLVYDAEDLRFREVNAFYYSNKLANLVQSSGGGLVGMDSVFVRANCMGFNDAFFFPEGNLICLGFTRNSEKTLWASHDGDVIVHEFGHAVNNYLASRNILSSSGEAGAIDEGVADYWAHTISGNSHLSEWFLGAIDERLTQIGSESVVTRDASDNHQYPDAMVYQVHSDSRPFAEVLWAIRQGLGKAKTDLLVNGMLQSLPSSTRFINASNALETATALQGLDPEEAKFVINVLTDKGIKRIDSADDVSISDNVDHKGVYVIDDHAISEQSGGNCNGSLDVNETALVLVNFKNSGAAPLGMATGQLEVTQSEGVRIPSGGDMSEYFRLPGSEEDFVDVLNEPVVKKAANQSLNDNVKIRAASFLVHAYTEGRKGFRVIFTPMGGESEEYDFPLDVGTIPTSDACKNPSLWPDNQTPMD